jgi:hypothetical protein
MSNYFIHTVCNRGEITHLVCWNIFLRFKLRVRHDAQEQENAEETKEDGSVEETGRLCATTQHPEDHEANSRWLLVQTLELCLVLCG